MEIIRGKQTSFINATDVQDMLGMYDSVHVDLGTGDGRFVIETAKKNPKQFVIGMDACRENLVKVSRRNPANTLFVIANAEALPIALAGIAAHVTINFPWGSLLQGLLEDDSSVMHRLVALTHQNALLDIHLNGGALQEQGYALEAGAYQVERSLLSRGFKLQAARVISANELKTFPTSWAKRLAFGRDPRAIHLRAVSGNGLHLSESA